MWNREMLGLLCTLDLIMTALHELARPCSALVSTSIFVPVRILDPVVALSVALSNRPRVFEAGRSLL